MILTFVGQYFVPELIAINGFIVILSPFIYFYFFINIVYWFSYKQIGNNVKAPVVLCTYIDMDFFPLFSIPVLALVSQGGSGGC